MANSDNPYVAPQSAVEDIPREREPAKRPAWVWVTAAILGVYGVGTVVILALALLMSAPDFPATYERLGRFNFAMTLIWACLTIGAAILLFMLRLRAIPLLWLAAGIVGTFDVFALVSMGPYSLFRTIFHAVFWGLILSYV